MPGANERAQEKAKTLPADVLIMDLEDSVAPEAKEDARALVCNAIASGEYGSRELVVRINALETPWGDDDLTAAARAAPDAILVPKVNSPDGIAVVAEKLADMAGARSPALWIMMETPLAVLNAASIGEAALNPQNRLQCMVMGTNDLAKETRASLGHGREAMIPWLMTCVAAARANGLDIIDGVYNDFRDQDGLRVECEQGVRLGMDGKTLIHPGQIAPCNELFSPGENEVAWARKIIAAFEQPENQGKGVINLDGRMVERLHCEMARRTVAIAEAIAGLEQPR